MNELLELELARSGWFLLLVPLIFGFVPGFVLRIVVLAYPPGDPRRRELIAELYAMSPHARPIWVAQQLETALFDGLPSRWRARRAAVPADRVPPGKLRSASTLLVLLFVTGGGVGIHGVQARADATSELERRAKPLSADLRAMKQSLAAADATVVREFLLASGADPRESRMSYEAEIERAATRLSHAALLIDDDLVMAAGFASIASQLPEYVGLVEMARTKGAATGLESLREASSLMQSTILRRADDLQRSVLRYLETLYERARAVPAVAVVACVIALVAFGALQGVFVTPGPQRL